MPAREGLKMVKGMEKLGMVKLQEAYDQLYDRTCPDEEFEAWVEDTAARLGDTLAKDQFYEPELMSLEAQQRNPRPIKDAQGRI
jgi:hypothetical protein